MRKIGYTVVGILTLLGAMRVYEMVITGEIMTIFSRS